MSDLPKIVVTWDWKEQPDLQELDAAVRKASGGFARVHEIDTGSDQFGIVVADHRVTPEEAAAAWDAR
jgi:hypothetical protein